MHFSLPPYFILFYNMPEMKISRITQKYFADSPEPAEMEAAINPWRAPDLPPRVEKLLHSSSQGGVIELCRFIGKRLRHTENKRSRRELEVQVIDWLYNLIRFNVRRGRVFDLGEVLKRGRADCNGYSKLFTVLGRMAGLDVGVIDVLMDNSGRLVAHTAIMVRLSDGKPRFVDLWYGARNIKHGMLGLRVKHGRKWVIADLALNELKDCEDVSYLPDDCVDGITHYIMGNRYLDRKEFDSAIKHYTKAIELYPGNSRLYYNRAIACENLGKRKEAEADYAQALRSDAAITRVLATEHEEVTSLIDLDDKGVDSVTQEIYLLHKGFVTGREVGITAIARKFGLPEEEVETILSSAETRLASSNRLE